MDKDDIRQLYTPEQAREISQAWDDFISLVTKGDAALWVLDVINYGDMLDLAQMCLDYASDN